MGSKFDNVQVDRSVPCLEVFESKAKPFLLTVALALSIFDVCANRDVFGAIVAWALVLVLSGFVIHQWLTFSGPAARLIRVDEDGISGTMTSMDQDKIIPWSAVKRVEQWIGGEVSIELKDRRRFTIPDYYIPEGIDLEVYASHRVDNIYEPRRRRYSKPATIFSDSLVPLKGL